MPEYMNFDEVMEALQLSAAELKQMIKDGRLAAFKDGNQVKFRGEDVDAVREGLETEPTIILPTDELDEYDESEALTEEAEIEIEEEEELEFSPEASDPEISVADSVELEEVPTVEMEDDSQHVTQDIEFQSEGEFEFTEDDTIMTNESVIDESLLDEEEQFEEEMDEEEEEEGAATAMLQFSEEDDEEESAASSRRRRRRGRQEEAPAAQSSIMVMIGLVMVFGILLFQGFIWIDTIRASKDTTENFDITGDPSQDPFLEQGLNDKKTPMPQGVVLNSGTWWAEQLGYNGPYPPINTEIGLVVDETDSGGIDETGGDDTDTGGWDNSGAPESPEEAPEDTGDDWTGGEEDTPEDDSGSDWTEDDSTNGEEDSSEDDGGDWSDEDWGE